jgi:hypothetical protein
MNIFARKLVRAAVAPTQSVPPSEKEQFRRYLADVAKENRDAQEMQKELDVSRDDNPKRYRTRSERLAKRQSPRPLETDLLELRRELADSVPRSSYITLHSKYGITDAMRLEVGRKSKNGKPPSEFLKLDSEFVRLASEMDRFGHKSEGTLEVEHLAQLGESILDGRVAETTGYSRESLLQSKNQRIEAFKGLLHDITKRAWTILVPYLKRTVQANGELQADVLNAERAHNARFGITLTEVPQICVSLREWQKNLEERLAAGPPKLRSRPMDMARGIFEL